MKLSNAKKWMASGVICMLAIPAFSQTAAGAALAQPIQVKDAWVRTTVPGQKGTGAFMKITATTATRLVGVASPVAGVAEVHEMKMQGDVMTMRRVPGIDLPAGKTVELKSGAYHVMLMDLKHALTKDTTVPMTLLFRDAKGLESRVELKLPVTTSAPGAPAGSGKAAGAHDHKH